MIDQTYTHARIQKHIYPCINSLTHLYTLILRYTGAHLCTHSGIRKYINTDCILTSVFKRNALYKKNLCLALLQHSEVSALVLDPSKAVKEYSRSSADQEEPLPHELRPPTILQLSMDYLTQKVMDISYTSRSDWFDFVWNRTRAIRKVEL